MPFLAEEHISIPTKDILSWACDGPAFDQDKPLYIDAMYSAKSISATQTKTLVRKLVAGFRNAGLKKGDTVLIHSFNNIYYPIIVLGIIATGGVFTGTSPSYTPHELKYAIRASKARFIITEPDLLPSITDAANESQIPSSQIMILDSVEEESITLGYDSWRTLLLHGSQDWVSFDDEETSKTTTAMLLFSSGTTGPPKAAMLSHYNLVAQHHIAWEHRPRPYNLSRLVALPLFHVATAPSTHVSPLRSGHVQVIMRRFETNAFLDYCEKFRISDLILVPPMVTAIVSSPLSEAAKKRKLRFIKSIIAGAAPLDAAMQARLQALLPPTSPFTQLWGMTEMTGLASLFDYPDNDDTASVGRFLPNLDVKIIDDDGKDISAYGVRGELAVRGPIVIRGYVGVPRERDFDDEGYFRTGDIVFVDEKSRKWYVVDRKKELIKVRGFQVAPAELEGVLLDHPSIRDAGVIGVPSVEGDSELPRAYIIKKEGEDVDERMVNKWVEERLAKYKSLTGGVKFVDAISKTASGKILKRLLREQAKKEMASRL